MLKFREVTSALVGHDTTMWQVGQQGLGIAASVAAVGSAPEKPDRLRNYWQHRSMTGEPCLGERGPAEDCPGAQRCRCRFKERLTGLSGRKASWYRRSATQLGTRAMSTCQINGVRNHDRTNLGIILIGMPGIDQRFRHYPQLHSRLGFPHRYRAFGRDELLFVLDRHWKRLGRSLDPDDFTDAEAIAAIERISRQHTRHRKLTTKSANKTPPKSSEVHKLGVLRASKKSAAAIEVSRQRCLVHRVLWKGAPALLG